VVSGLGVCSSFLRLFCRLRPAQTANRWCVRPAAASGGCARSARTDDGIGEVGPSRAGRGTSHQTGRPPQRPHRPAGAETVSTNTTPRRREHRASERTGGVTTPGTGDAAPGPFTGPARARYKAGRPPRRTRQATLRARGGRLGLCPKPQRPDSQPNPRRVLVLPLEICGWLVRNGAHAVGGRDKTDRPLGG